MLTPMPTIAPTERALGDRLLAAGEVAVEVCVKSVD
jgi:hypothetical protein